MNFLVIYIAENCATCERVVLTAKSISSSLPNVELEIKNFKEAKRNLTIVPAVFLNHRLYCYGDFDKRKLIKMIEKQSHQELD